MVPRRHNVGMQFDFIDVEAMSVVVRSANCTHAALGPTITSLFEGIIKSNPELESVGPPLVKYLAWTNESCTIEAGFPVGPGTTCDSQSAIRHYPSYTALMATFVGPYSGLSDAWIAMWKHIEAEGIQADMPCWDWYVGSPEPDPNAAVTELYVPLKSV